MKNLGMFCQLFKNQCMVINVLYVGCCCTLFVGCEKMGLTKVRPNIYWNGH